MYITIDNEFETVAIMETIEGDNQSDLTNNKKNGKSVQNTSTSLMKTRQRTIPIWLESKTAFENLDDYCQPK